MKPITRREMVRTIALGATAAVWPASLRADEPAPTTSKSDRLNIVWIFCDELRTDAIGCYGHPKFKLHTPHLDRLAAGGILFTNQFCNSPVCVPSRVATLTGRYPEQTGVYNNEAAWGSFRLPQPPLTFPKVFHQNGYATGTFGKIHVANGMAHETIFQTVNTEGGDMGFWSKLGANKVGMIRSPGRGMQGGIFPDDVPYPPEKVVDNGLEWIRRRINKPFFARFSILQPHTPVLPPKKFYDLYADQDFGVPDKIPDTVSAFERRVAQIHGLERMDPAKMREARRCYYAAVAWVDSQVGRVLDFLDKNGLRQNTLIMFGADHGTPVGDTGAFEKHTFAPCNHRVPLIMSCPSRINPGQVRRDICDSLDVGRTAMTAAGLDIPNSFHGRDLLNSKPPEAIYATIGYGEVGSKMGPNGGRGDWFGGRGWPRRSCIRTERFRLDMNMRIDGKAAPSAPEDRDVFLADVKADPLETVNLAGDAKYADEVRRLTGLLEKHAHGAVEVPAECLRRGGKTEVE